MHSKFEYVKSRIDEINGCIKNNEPLVKIAKLIGVKQSTLVSHLKKLGIEYKGNRSRKGLPHKEQRVTADAYFTNERFINASKLRRILIRDGFKEEKCECCGLSEWMGKPIPLELHHKDFNHYNNDIKNITILCANCHMQAHNYNNNTK